jgi:hypothetical protein
VRAISGGILRQLRNVNYRRSDSPETGYRINGGIGKKSSDENVKKIELDSRF